MNYNFNSIVIDGVSAAVPKDSSDIADSNILSPLEKSIINKQLGIKRAHKSTNETSFTLAKSAALNLLKKLEWDASSVDILINVTQTPDFLMPSNAFLLHEALKLKPDAVAFEINTGCTGYVNALLVASTMLNGNTTKRALVLTGETTYNVSKSDKSTLPYIGDAGTASALSYSNNKNRSFFNTITNGAFSNAIFIPDGGADSYRTNKDDRQSILIKDLKVQMNGELVKNFVFKNVAPTIMDLYESNNLTIPKTDYFIFHQVNRLFTRALSKKLNIPLEKTLTCFEEYGNTSSCSIPLTICHHHERLNGTNNQLLLSGFGVGMANYNAIVQLTNARIEQIVEI